LKSVRQAAVGAYFVDFLCRERKMAVEVDGGTHGAKAEITYDAARAAELARLGYRVFRVSNRDVLDNIEPVLDALVAFVENGD
jgi:very-short-patch-repair endonuclease